MTSCPSLESLTLCSCGGLTRVVVLSATIKRLELYGLLRDDVGRVEILSAPALRVLIYSGKFAKLGALEGMPKLEEAILLSEERRPFPDRRRWRDFICAFAHAQVLCVSCWFFQFALDEDTDFGVRPAVFKNLRELHWWPAFKKMDSPCNAEPFTGASLRALISVLRDCPSLELLCVHRNYYWEAEAEEEWRMNWLYMKAQNDDWYGSSDDDDPWKEVPRTDPLEEFQKNDYCLPRLKMVKVLEYSGKREEVQLVDFLLDKAVNLKSMILYYVPEIADNLRRLQQQVSTLHRGSSVASVSLLEHHDDACPKDRAMSWYKGMDI